MTCTSLPTVAVVVAVLFLFAGIGGTFGGVVDALQLVVLPTTTAMTTTMMMMTTMTTTTTTRISSKKLMSSAMNGKYGYHACFGRQHKMMAADDYYYTGRSDRRGKSSVNSRRWGSELARMMMIRPSSFSALQSWSFLSPSSPSPSRSPSSSRPLPLFDHHSSDPDSCFTPDFRSQSSMLNGRRSRPTTTTALKAAVLYSSTKDETTDDDNEEEEEEEEGAFESVDDVESEAAMPGNNAPKMVKPRTKKRTEAQDKLWQQRYVEMKQYQNANNGSSYPPTGTSLRTWAAHQRKQYNQGQLFSDRKKLLTEINFQWSKPRTRIARSGWDEMNDRLVKYKEKYGNTNVAQYYQDDPKLGRWCYSQKKAYVRGILDPKKKAKLDAIGFVFDEVVSNDQRWNETYNLLVEYWKENGHSNFPQRNKKDPKLGLWAQSQRTAYKKGKLSVDRIEMLDSIGFVWDRQDAAWFEMYNRLVEYWKETGHSNLPTDSKNDPKLTKWVQRQRTGYKEGKLSVDRIEMLDSIGFAWDCHNAAWFEMYNRLVEYWKETGHANFPISSKKDPKLGEWVRAQRAAYKKGKLSVDRIEMLESVGFAWERQDAAWFEMYNRLVEYWKETGHANFSIISKKDPKLGLWAQSQRTAYKKGKLSVDRIEMLDSIGFVWDCHNAAWFEMYNRLVEYWKENGHSNFPQRNKKDPKLGLWVQSQRAAYKQGKLSVDRIEMLESIGFSWNRRPEKGDL